mmetsp:Transcript_3820/g.12154  ORF Transcript_3820/g.12154 Transcript_3820/m.12154 type:complete len:461 (+) Transcript_3820:465-1847(+)
MNGRTDNAIKNYWNQTLQRGQNIAHLRASRTRRSRSSLSSSNTTTNVKATLRAVGGVKKKYGRGICAEGFVKGQCRRECVRPLELHVSFLSRKTTTKEDLRFLSMDYSELVSPLLVHFPLLEVLGLPGDKCTTLTGALQVGACGRLRRLVATGLSERTLASLCESLLPEARFYLCVLNARHTRQVHKVLWSGGSDRWRVALEQLRHSVTFNEAVRREQLEVIKLFLEARAPITSSVLDGAAAASDERLLRLLLSPSVPGVHREDLARAVARSSSSRSVECLLAAGADGYHTLLASAEFGNETALRALFARGVPVSRVACGTAMDAAARMGRARAMQLLLDAGAVVSVLTVQQLRRFQLDSMLEEDPVVRARCSSDRVACVAVIFQVALDSFWEGEGELLDHLVAMSTSAGSRALCLTVKERKGVDKVRHLLHLGVEPSRRLIAWAEKWGERRVVELLRAS